jgi:predicted nucleotidyltransferase component of viral defense system
MILPSQYYEESLYPLQDGVLNTISRSGTDFFLTGGTALSRAYYQHRYSDDLDFFLNNSSSYDEQADVIFALLREDGFIWDTEDDFIRSKNFITFRVTNKNFDIKLKLDLVNDLVPHFGGLDETKLFYKTDSIRNILSNKLSAIFRFAAKDIADIREIVLHETVNWPEIIQEARQKEAGLELPYIGEILTGIPKSEFETITWIKKPDWQVFQNDINRIVFNMMNG